MKWRNCIQLVGYLGQDPVIRKIPGGRIISIFRLATNDGFSGRRKQETQWHTVRLPVKNTGRITNNFMKGSHVLVEGSLEYYIMQRDGVDMEKAFINATQIMNLDRFELY